MTKEKIRWTIRNDLWCSCVKTHVRTNAHEPPRIKEEAEKSAGISPKRSIAHLVAHEQQGSQHGGGQAVAGLVADQHVAVSPLHHMHIAVCNTSRMHNVNNMLQNLGEPYKKELIRK